MSLKNVFLKALVRLVRPFLIQQKERGKRILVVATTALGDTLWATPALTSLRDSFPEAYIAALTSPVGFEVLKKNPHISRLYLLKGSVLFLWRALYRERFDTVLIFHASQRFIPPLCALLGASQVVGTVGHQKGLDSLLTDCLPNPPQHEILRRLAMVQRIGGRITSELLSFPLEPKERKALPPGRWIVLHPGAKDSFKRWPIALFAEVGQELQKQLDCNILITGTSGERSLLEELRSQIPHSQIKENLPLHSFAALLAEADLLISNDTGPVHVACALSRPVIALYSPTDPSLCGPHLALHAIAIAKKATCTPCLKRKCRRPFCLLQISPEEVIEAATQLLRKLKA